LWLGDTTGIKSAQDDSVIFGVLELRLWLGDTTDIKSAQDDSVILGFFGMVVVVGVGNGG
jgi:hypothetical protein